MSEENINNEVIEEDVVIDAASQEVAEDLTADINVGDIEAEVVSAGVSGSDCGPSQGSCCASPHGSRFRQVCLEWP